MNWSSEHLQSAKVAAHRSKQRTCAYKMLFQSFPTLCTYVDIEVTHMINGLRPSPSIGAYCKHQNWVVNRPGNETKLQHYKHQKLGSEKREEFPIERVHGSLVPRSGGGGGERSAPGNDANFISLSWTMSSNILHFANVQKFNTCKKWAPPHTTLANLDTFISTKSLSGLSLLLRFCYKIGLWQSSILMPNSFV